MKEIEGVAGVHVMAYRQEELVAEIIEEAGLLPRPYRKGVTPAPSPRIPARSAWFEGTRGKHELIMGVVLM